MQDTPFMCRKPPITQIIPASFLLSCFAAQAMDAAIREKQVPETAGVRYICGTIKTRTALIFNCVNKLNILKPNE
jgi:hypothetical protein